MNIEKKPDKNRIFKALSIALATASLPCIGLATTHQFDTNLVQQSESTNENSRNTIAPIPITQEP